MANLSIPCGIAIFAVLIAASIRQAEPQQPDYSGVSERYCAAVAAMRAPHDGSWLAQAITAKTALNTGDACAALPRLLGHVPAHPTGDEVPEWITAQRVVTAVTSGDYDIAPAQCATATAIQSWPPTAGTPPESAAPLCVVGGLLFARTTSERAEARMGDWP